MRESPQRSWLPWISIGVLALLCGSVALLQNHWITAVSRAERERLQQQLQTSLNHLSREFNAEIANACAALLPAPPEIEALGREKAYSNRYLQWRQSHDRMFQRVGVASSNEKSSELLMLNTETAQFAAAAWPAEWSSVRELTSAPMLGPREFLSQPVNIIVLPRIAGPPPGRRFESWEQEWLILEVNLDYVRTSMIPDLLHRYLSTDGNRMDYQAEVVAAGDPKTVVYRSSPDLDRTIEHSPDASVPLFDVHFGAMVHATGRPHRGFQTGPPPMRLRFHEASPRMETFGPVPPPGEMGPGRWRLLVRHQAGSLDAVVARARWQNLAASLTILLLILATVAMLVRYSRRAQQLAELQMNFVAGVSHELRTPLTVIRTAAFNLRGKLANRPDQVERYGSLIQEQSEKLGRLVEQVLLFSKARAGRTIKDREPVAVTTVIDEAIGAAVPEGSRFSIEKHLEADLPLVLADQLALKHAVQNLIENAMKYGTEESNWIGVFATRIADENGPAVEVRVVDRGRGIPAEEQQRIFDPFFRGRRAVEEQIHGTGLGLNLVKNILEAHGGSVSVRSEPGRGAEFVMRIPTAPELKHEFAHSVG